MSSNEVMPIFGGFDEFGCFNIAEFDVGDCLLVYVNREKIRGVVCGVNTKNNMIAYKNASGVTSCHINDVCLLAQPESGWLS